MKLIKDLDEDIEYLDLEETDIDCHDMHIHNCDGYGAYDVQVLDYILTWAQVDVLKNGIAEAERLWRKDNKSDKSE
jgi:hypothetical protein